MKMPLVLSELLERLSRLDEVILLDLLEINSEDILERFSDKINDKLSLLVEELDDDIGDIDAGYDD